MVTTCWELNHPILQFTGKSTLDDYIAVAVYVGIFVFLTVFQRLNREDRVRQLGVGYKKRSVKCM